MRTPSGSAAWVVWADFAGVAVFAISGALAGEQRGLDVLGIAVLAAVTAIGGGTVRDLLIGRPVFWISDARYLSVIAVTVAIVLLWLRFFSAPASALVVADTLGLAFVAIAGAQIAVVRGLPWLTVVVAGTFSGCGGGVIRDVITARIPVILRSDVYASAAIGGIVVYLILFRSKAPPKLAAGLGMTTVVALRAAAINYGWSLPHPIPALP